MICYFYSIITKPPGRVNPQQSARRYGGEGEEGRNMNKKQEEFLEKKEKLLQMGGPDKVAKQHAKGKLTARERLDLLFDKGTFVEYGMFVKHRKQDFGLDKKYIPGDGVVAGYGKVNGRTVYAFAQDFTSMGGSVGEMTGKKMTRIHQLAIENGCPVVELFDGAGGRIQEGNDIPHQAYVFYEAVRGSGYIPQISAIMGPCAGGASYLPALQDYIICVEHSSSMFLTGPKVIKQVTGEICPPDFGTGRFCNEVSGVSHGLAPDDYTCIEMIKQYLSYFPQNSQEMPPVYRCDEDPDELRPELNDIVPDNPRKSYDMHDIIRLIADKDSLFEYYPLFAPNSITTLARLNGRSVGIVANDTRYKAGVCDIDSADKMSRFVSLCDCFNIPLIFLGDTPGFLPGLDQERGGVIRHGAKTIFANCTATVPKIRVTIRKLYGGASTAMCDTGCAPDCTISWPNAEEAVMGAAGACAIIFASELKKIQEEQGQEAYQKRLDELSEDYERTFNNPYRRAEIFSTDMIIMPDETRRVLIQVLDDLKTKKYFNMPPKKHSLFPV